MLYNKHRNKGEHKMKKKVIYALFDDGNQSVKKTLEPLGYEVYSFGVQKKDSVIECDLTNLEDFFKKAKDLPDPDFIFANPPCETFSSATNGTYLKSGRTGNKYYYHDTLEPVLDFEDWISHNNVTIKNIKNKREVFEKSRETLFISEKLHKNTEVIIDFYKVPFAIENPHKSLAWKKYYLNKHKTLTNYLCYDDSFTKKPTFICSNIPLVLKKDTKGLKSKTKWSKMRNYNSAARVPASLITSIMRQIEQGCEK